MRTSFFYAEKERAHAFLSQWHAFSEFVPELLALHAAHTLLPQERANIVKNLYSELGLDGDGVSHSELLSDLIFKATGKAPSKHHTTKETDNFIFILIEAANEKLSAFNSGLLCGLEHVAYDILGVLKEVLTKMGNPELVQHPYITIHEKVEAEHIEHTEENNRLYGSADSDVEEGFNYIMDEWQAFWNAAYLQLLG